MSIAGNEIAKNYGENCEICEMFLVKCFSDEAIECKMTAKGFVKD